MTINRYLPNQHGAWAMLLLPFLTGLSAAGGSIDHIPLFLCWLLMYLFSFPLLQWIKTGKKERYFKPAALYGALLVPLAAVVIAAEPRLIGYGALLLILFAIPVYYAKMKNERALLNDIAAIVLFCSFIYPVVYVSAGSEADWGRTTLLFILLGLYFVGTALYVKTIIREKKNPRYYRLSLAYHTLLLPFAAWLSVPLLVPFAILLLRAAVLPKRNLKVKQTGMAEVGFALMLYVSVVLAYL
ncbi:YwiC-like family protein [Saccharibacillus sp. CPCC 101409]|uniref:YwiC-like family protein n=1 Tax=Saccharibacillus sp. CPCC 101409 TaxID=3058041 RepID=UPI00267247AC|nr:YwiC-like family protein [Saccharibacillus sp. CPCC 101409]MDO3412332.1 YwiC-like family protein [Saccharibacillus sp. CPCC 101409]